MLGVGVSPVLSIYRVSHVERVLIGTIHLDQFHTNVVGCVYVTMCP